MAPYAGALLFDSKDDFDCSICLEHILFNPGHSLQP